MLVLNFPAFENKWWADERFHGNGPYGEILTKKEPIRTFGFTLPYNEYMLLTGWEVRIGKTCDRGLENAARGRRHYAFISPPKCSTLMLHFFPLKSSVSSKNVTKMLG